MPVSHIERKFVERKWTWPYQPSDDSWIVGVFCWFFVGAIAFCVVASETKHQPVHGKGGHLTWPAFMVLAFWIGPFVLGGIGYAVGWCWVHRPRRVWVPVSEDARAAHRRELDRIY